jgi:CRP/FNR family transcriptional regulator, cyclic AMP receptor protein
MAATVPLDEDRVKLSGRLAGIGLPAELVADILNDNIVVRYAKGFRPFFQGAPADMLMLVLTGVVKVYCPQKGARRFLVELAGPGDVIGYADFVDQKGRRSQVFEAEALTNCSVALILRHRLAKRIEELDSAGLVSLLEMANTFWTSVVYRHASLMCLPFRERLEVVLSEVAHRFGVKESRGLLITLDLGHEEWAEMIGCSRPMVSRLFAQMVDSGVLAREGKRYILLTQGGLDDRQRLLVHPGSAHAAELRLSYGGGAGASRLSAQPR